MNSNAKRLMVALQIGGIGLAIAIIGGIVGKMQREDDWARH